ncbi:hypothetical protein AVEN_198031-1 [Araneus ventricosus]|uniref:Uncharacterized protein n=1 Tax=Araneus ventricosus TaxID=182803 RepID=A0A4Y2S929_ARAVE|nr:hypothetical protein AVEN_198031-1 [Araneus ventricosus]
MYTKDNATLREEWVPYCEDRRKFKLLELLPHLTEQPFVARFLMHNLGVPLKSLLTIISAAFLLNVSVIYELIFFDLCRYVWASLTPGSHYFSQTQSTSCMCPISSPMLFSISVQIQYLEYRSYIEEPASWGFLSKLMLK